jgi:heat shock protein HslJ
MWRAILAVTTGLVVAPVQAQAPAQPADSTLTGPRWRVVEIAGGPAVHKEMLQFEAAKITAKAACNYMHVDYKVVGQALEIGRPVITRMFCKGRMADENGFIDALRAVRGYRLAGDGLVLVAGDGRVLLRLRR